MIKQQRNADESRNQSNIKGWCIANNRVQKDQQADTYGQVNHAAKHMAFVFSLSVSPFLDPFLLSQILESGGSGRRLRFSELLQHVVAVVAVPFLAAGFRIRGHGQKTEE